MNELGYDSKWDVHVYSYTSNSYGDLKYYQNTQLFGCSRNITFLFNPTYDKGV